MLPEHGACGVMGDLRVSRPIDAGMVVERGWSGPGGL